MIRLAKIKKGDESLRPRIRRRDPPLSRCSSWRHSSWPEINPFLVLWTWIKKMLSKRPKTGSNPEDRITVHWKNFWNADLHDADVVFVYLLPWRMGKLESMLKPNASPAH